MASSAYWKKKSDEQNKAISNYNSQIKVLEAVQKALDDNLSDEVRAVNLAIDMLQDELEVSVRHEQIFIGNTTRITTRKERGTSADATLKVASNEINNEIVRLKNKKSNAESSKATYDQNYSTEKKNEREALLQSIFG